jgi:DNA-binding LytR/AlgR family response regulator
MKMLKCIIVDDEPVARKILMEFSAQVPFLQVAGQFENTLKAEAFLKTEKTELIFLDIEMPKRSGLEYLKNTSSRPLVILTTAFPEYALQGYELDIIDYLLKPISFDRFHKAVQKAREFSEMKDARYAPANSSFLFVRSEKRIEKIDLKDILYIESIGNYVNIYTVSKKIIAYLTLKGLEAQLPQHEFLKTHQSFLVNFPRISSIEGNQVLINGASIPISRNYKEALMKIVENRMLKR